MKTQTMPQTTFDASIVSQIACPACYGDLRNDGRVRLICISCARSYRIVDGIPVLIVERADTPPE